MPFKSSFWSWYSRLEFALESTSFGYFSSEFTHIFTSITVLPIVLILIFEFLLFPAYTKCSSSSSEDQMYSSSYNLLSASMYHHPNMMQTSSITSSSSIPLGLSGNNSLSFYQYQQHHSSSHHHQPSMLQTSHSLGHHQPLDQLAYTEEVYPPTAGIDEQYIYVTYPSEMKPMKHSDRYEVLMSNDGYVDTNL